MGFGVGLLAGCGTFPICSRRYFACLISGIALPVLDLYYYRSILTPSQSQYSPADAPSQRQSDQQPAPSSCHAGIWARDGKDTDCRSLISRVRTRCCYGFFPSLSISLFLHCCLCFMVFLTLAYLNLMAIIDDLPESQTSEISLSCLSQSHQLPSSCGRQHAQPSPQPTAPCPQHGPSSPVSQWAWQGQQPQFFTGRPALRGPLRYCGSAGGSGRGLLLRMASLFKSGMGGLLFIYLSVALLVIIIFGWLFCCVQYRINYIYRKQSFAPMKKTVKYRRQPKTSIMESNFKQTVPSRKKLQKMEPSMMPLLASPEKISNQILKQVSEALKLLQIIKASLPQTLSSKRIASNPVLEEYRAIQQQLREKQRSITCLEGDIKELKISMVTGWAKEMRGSFGHEIKSMREGLMHVVEEYRGKMGKLDREREKVRKLENQYVIQCLRTGAQVVSYDTFLEHYMNKVQPFTISTTSNIKSQNRLRDKSKKHLQEKDHNKMSTHKKIPSPSPGLGTKKMQDLLTHRDVISSALRAAKKKHHNETNQYRSKLQFLKDQYRSLEEKVVSKIKELRVAQEKFKERRAKEKGKSKSKRKSESKSQSKRSLRTQRTERTERLITMCTQER